MIRPLLVVVALTTFAAAANVAQASEHKARARAAVKAAASAYRSKNFALAAKKYVEAYEILEANNAKRKPELLYNAGLAFERASSCASAVVYYERYADALGGRLNADAASRLERARRCAPEVAIQTTPSGAEVVIDEIPRGHAPLTVPLEAGGHRVVLKLDGYEVVEKNVAIEAGRPKAIAETLKRIFVPTRLTIRVASSGEVRLDDKRVGAGPIERTMNVTSGSHRIDLVTDGCQTRSRPVDVPEGTTVVAELDEPCEALVTTGPVVAAPAAPASSSFPWIIGGVGALALATSGVFFAMSINDRSTIDEEVAKGPSMSDADLIRSLNADIKTQNIVAGVALSVGVVAISAAVVLLLTDEDPSVARRASDGDGFSILAW